METYRDDHERQAATPETRPAQLREHLERLRDGIAALRDDRDRLRARVGELEAQLAAQEELLATHLAALNDLVALVGPAREPAPDAQQEAPQAPPGEQPWGEQREGEPHPPW
ncbi:MAG TPA: hypothetical protein VFL91_15385 [Thermomicrobiales bacterium]|nr:hypothetical protein [Thermomicrobiales bacterium]